MIRNIRSVNDLVESIGFIHLAIAFLLKKKLQSVWIEAVVGLWRFGFSRGYLTFCLLL